MRLVRKVIVETRLKLHANKPFAYLLVAQRVTPRLLNHELKHELILVDSWLKRETNGYIVCWTGLGS